MPCLVLAVEKPLLRAGRAISLVLSINDNRKPLSPPIPVFWAVIFGFMRVTGNKQFVKFGKQLNILLLNWCVHNAEWYIHLKGTVWTRIYDMLQILGLEMYCLSTDESLGKCISQNPLNSLAQSLLPTLSLHPACLGTGQLASISNAYKYIFFPCRLRTISLTADQQQPLTPYTYVISDSAKHILYTEFL